MSEVLFFGRRQRPRVLVVMFHGLNDSAACCADGVAGPWAVGLDGALVVVPQSQDLSFWSSDSADPGYDWLRQRGTHDTSDWTANVRELHRVVRARVRKVNVWLDALLERHGLTNRQLILTGFSQGAILAAVCGARRRALGCVVCGGVPGQPVYSAHCQDYIGGGWMDWGALIPASAKRGSSRTKFCAVNGTQDPFVPRGPLESMLAPFETKWHWHEGRGHDFPRIWYKWSLAWMRQLLASSES